jgi:PAS domain S-box-containing protein
MREKTTKVIKATKPTRMTVQSGQELLSENEAAYLLAAIVTSSHDAIVSKTLDSNITSWNRAAEKLFGYKAEEVIGKHISIIIPKHLIHEEDIIIGKLRRGQRIDHFETTRRRKDGQLINVSLSISPIKDKSGKIIGAAKIARDITAQKSAENKMAENEERLRLALDAGRIGVWEWDIPRDVISWSDRVYEIHGVNKKNFVLNFVNYSKRIYPEDRESTEKSIQDALSGRKAYNTSFRIIWDDGSLRWVATRAVVLRDDSGKPLRMLGATMDITEEKKLEQDKNDFVSIATHELKTPVTSLKAYAEVLRRRFVRAGDISSAENMVKMNAQLDRLTNLISDMLDATKIDAGKLHMSEEKFDMDGLIAEITEALQLTTEKHKLIIKGKIKKSITADRERTGQVLTNLITNAIKYSPKAADIEIQGSSGSNGSVKICVKDLGIGIPKEKQQKLFQRFYRVSGPNGNTFPGLGLGLFISSEIIKRQGGKIWVESEPNAGSKFCFILPQKAKGLSKNNN